MIQEINHNLKIKLKDFANYSFSKHLNTPGHLQIYMEYYVFAVWAEMSLLNSLKIKYTRNTNPWIPYGEPELRNLIHKTVLQEESSSTPSGEHQSKFEIFMDAMRDSDADTEKICNFLRHVSHGTDVFLVIAVSKLPLSIKQYLKEIFDIISEGKPHKIAASLVFNKAAMMDSVLIDKISNFDTETRETYKLFEYYLQLQSEKELELPFQILERLCSDNDENRIEAESTAETILQHHINLKSAIKNIITNKTG